MHCAHDIRLKFLFNQFINRHAWQAVNLRKKAINDGLSLRKGRKNRTVPISKELYDSLPEDKKGRLFSDCYGAFRSASERTDIALPAGQLIHVLRHTFASHFMMNGSNILVLQCVLGHTDIEMTMRYAHFATDHLEDTIRLNPLDWNEER